MKKKSIFAGITLLVCLSFAQAASATPPHTEHPGGGGGSKPPVCKSYPCPIAP